MISVVISRASFICLIRARVVTKTRWRIRVIIAHRQVHLETETRVRNYVTALSYQIWHNSGDGTTPNKKEIRSLRQINLRPHEIFQRRRLQGVSGSRLWHESVLRLRGQVSDFNPRDTSPLYPSGLIWRRFWFSPSAYFHIDTYHHNN